VSASQPRAGRALADVGRARSVFASTVAAWFVLAWIGPATLVPTAVAMAETPQASQTQELTQLAEGKGRDLTVGRCIICHTLEYIPSNAAAMNRAGWEKSVQKMRDRFGAPITDDEARQIVDYLASNYAGKP
jgi:sulfite dehydrogenase (cytochrome) subunit B